MADVAVIGVPEDSGEDAVCAVLVARNPDEPPSLDEVRRVLTATGMTSWYLPTLIEVVPELPRDQLGKVQKVELVKRLQPGHP